MTCKLCDECDGPLWTCKTCGAQFCLDHSNVTGLGSNVECIDCESSRLDSLDADLLRPHPAERVLDAFDRKEKQDESRNAD